MVTEVLKPETPQVLLNRELLRHMPGFDVTLLGYSDSIVATLCHRLGWNEILGPEHSPSQGTLQLLLMTMTGLCICVQEGSVEAPAKGSSCSLEQYGHLLQ